MILYLIREKHGIEATAEYDVDNKRFVVKKGSTVSLNVNQSASFRGTKSIIDARSNGTVVDRVVMRDVAFKSASTAANFITGASTNGLKAWKNSDGVYLKDILEGLKSD